MQALLSVKHFIVTTCILLSGCVSIATDSGTMSGNAIEPENNALSSGQSERMIVATITNQYHQEITGGQPINMVSAEGPEPPPATYSRFLKDLRNRYGVTTVADWPLASLGVRCFIFEIEDATLRDSVIERLQLDQRIETAQPMQVFSVLSDSYNDPYLKLQSNYKSLDIDKSHRWTTGKGVKIAVIDTGTDYNHEDLKSQIIEKKNFVDNDNIAFSQDKHGTAISGVIAASTNNATGMAGIAPDAQLLPMKACWQTGTDSDKAACSSFTLAKALNYVIGKTVEIINFSLSGPADPLLERLIQRALDEQITIVAAVGEDATRNFPASMPGVIAVNESESAPVLQNTLRAPGKQILATSPGNQYDFFSGSSFSTAQVSGMIALIKERKPHLSNDNIFSVLKKKCEELNYLEA